MRPEVDSNSTFITFAELDVRKIDLLDDAWGFARQFPEQLIAISLISPIAPDYLVNELLCRISSFRDSDSGKNPGADGEHSD
jgi:hypothetical protein